MKKIAICFYGQPRKLEEGYYSIQQSFYNKYENIDTFVHTWFDENKEKYDASTYRNIDENELKIDKKCIEKIKELYSPVQMIVDKPVSFDFTNISQSRMYKNSNQTLIYNLSNTFSQIYSKYQVGKIFEKYSQQYSIQYDIVICIRFDFLNIIPINICSLLENKIYSSPQKDNRFLIDDNLIICTNQQLFLYYAKTFENIPHFCDDSTFEIICRYVFESFEMSPETLFTANFIYCLGNKIHQTLIFHPDIPIFF
jgi:hypothetical protein